MEEYGDVKYISTRGLGYEGTIKLFTDNNKLYTISQMSGKPVEVQWLEEGVSVEPIPVKRDKNSW